MALASAAAYGALNGYWGQSGGPDLRTFCDSGIQYATLAFVNMAPENDRSSSGFPGINFSSHCWADAYPGEFGGSTQLLSHCESLKRDIPYCQARGVKVLLSIGGEYRKPAAADDLSSDYRVSSRQSGEYFADFLYGAFGPYSEHWKGPRPFDGADAHVAVDGFDFDIEAMFDNEPYIAMINKFRALDSGILITGAPQCPTSPQYFQMQGMVQKAAFDALFIQFYNNPSCDAVAGGDAGDRFNLDDWVAIVAGSEKSGGAKLFVGLPASPSAAGSGYIGPDEVKDLVCRHKDTKNFGGVSLWDLKNAAGNVSNGKAFYEHVLDALRYGCGPVPATTAAATAATTTTTTQVESASPSSSAYFTSPSSISTVSTSPSSMGPPSTSTSTSVESTSPSSSEYFTSPSSMSTPSTSTSTPGEPLSTTTWASYTATTSTPVPANSTKPATTPGSRTWYNTTMTSPPLTTSTVYATTVRTITACPPEVPDCPLKSKVVTETVPLYTTVCPVSPTAQPPRSTAHAEEPPSSVQSSAMTTSTVFTTRVHVVPSCRPEAADCRGGKRIFTETIPLYTTVCPVTQTARSSEPAATRAPPAGTPSQSELTSTSTRTSLVLTTSTVYTTRSHTVTMCSPEVTDCHRVKVTTEVVPLYTTVCPVAPTAGPSTPGHASESVSPATTVTESPPPQTSNTSPSTETQAVTPCLPGAANCPEEQATGTEAVTGATTPPGVKTSAAESETETAPANVYPIPAASPSSTLERLAKLASATPNPGKANAECMGPGCVGESASTAAVSSGPRLPNAGLNYTSPAAPVPTSSWTAGPVPTSSWTAGPVRPSVVSVVPVPVAAGASRAAMGLVGLGVLVAAQALAM